MKKFNTLTKKITEEKDFYKHQTINSSQINNIIGESKILYTVLEQITKVASTDTTVLITGETGVGKELVAHAIQKHSSRENKPYIIFNCSAMPESLISSELFGHEKGSFTGATNRKIGRFELADDGTLFLDEIGDISLEAQVKLLRVLQTKQFERVGGIKTLNTNFRLITATNRNLEDLVKNGSFRADLFYRLNVFSLHVPALRERREDIPILAKYFLNIYNKKTGKKISKIANNDVDKLINYDWPGNVRELENVIERSVILSSGSTLHVSHLLDFSSHANANVKTNMPIHQAVTLREMEYQHIVWALHQTKWKVRGSDGAAKLLDINPSTLYFRMNKLGIERPQ